MHAIRSFRDLLVWQKAMNLSVFAYQAARAMPRQDQLVLGHHLRKTSVSLPSNVAEGFSRHSRASYVQHLWIAHASGAELETQVELGRRIGVISEDRAEMLIKDAREVGRMINGLIRALERSA